MSKARTQDRKVVLLTGASGPIGTALCRAYAKRYDIVAVQHERPLAVTTQLQAFVDPLAPSGSPAKAAPGVFELTADLLEPSEVARVVEVALARYGRIDAVVNAVGAFGEKSDLLGDGLDVARELYALNALVPIAVAVRVARASWRHEADENRARNRVVVNLSAAAAVDAADRTRGAAFGATKAALQLLSLRLAEELRPFHVRVVAVAPAPVPAIVTAKRVTAAVGAMLEGDETGRVLLLWDDGDELV